MQRNNVVSFGQNKSDSFEKKSQRTYSDEELTKILNGDFQRLNKDFFDSLSPEEYQFCLDWANTDEKKFSGMVQFSPKSVLREDVKDVIKYADFYYSGLQKIAYKSHKDMKNIILVGIGQSPVSTAKMIELTGVKTGHCPMSGLTTLKEPIDKYVTKENIDKYFKHWKKFGFDINDLFGDKLIIFTDYKESGRTLEVFKKIINKIIEIKKPEMDKQGEKTAEIKFLSLRSIYNTSKKETKERKWGDDFEVSVFHSSYLKTLYSPLFKLPLPKIHEILKRHALSKETDRHTRFNKLTVLLYDELYHPKPDKEKTRFSPINAERQFRLSFYTPDL